MICASISAVEAHLLSMSDGAPSGMGALLSGGKGCPL
jgi:hypothetical protein